MSWTAEDPRTACASALEGLDARERTLLEEALGWVGMRVDDPAGERIGRVAGVLVDRERGVPQWVMVRPNARSDARIAVPFGAVTAFGHRLVASFERREVRTAPPVRDEALTARFERELCSFYGMGATRGARLGDWERRRTSAAARRLDDGGLCWEPPPRGLATSARPS